MEQEKKLSLEIDDNSQHQKWEEIIQNIAWVVLLALLVAISLGLFGRGGPLSNVKASSEDGSFQIEYDRFIRYDSSDKLKVTAESATDILQIKLDSLYADDIKIERIVPEPERSVISEDSVTYYFPCRPKSQVRVAFHISPEKYGKINGWVSAGNGTRQSISQFVYP